MRSEASPELVGSAPVASSSPGRVKTSFRDPSMKNGKLAVKPDQLPPPPPPSRGRGLHVRKYSPANWLTESGVMRKRKELEKKGLPDFTNWRFLTLTVDREKFGHDPLNAFLKIRPRIRYFQEKARKAGLWSSSDRWAWKLEFQADGWPHWHFLIEHKEKWTHDQLRSLNDLWGFGMASVERVRPEKEFIYSFKYAFKPVVQLQDDFFSDEPPSVAPQWFLDYLGKSYKRVCWTDADGLKHSELVEKPDTLGRVRFWQTSRVFYEGPKAKSPPSKAPVSSLVPQVARMVANRIDALAQVVSRTGKGRYIASAVIALSIPFGQFSSLAVWQILGGNGAALAPQSYVLAPHVIETNTYTANKWQLNQLKTSNRLRVHRAQFLAASGNTLSRC